MHRTARRLFTAILAVPALLVVGATAAFAKVAPDGPGTFQPPVTTHHGGDSISFADRAQWMGAGAAAVLAVIVIYVAATALVHRHQQVAGRQLRTS
jgi:hypothetical protein